MTGEFSAWTMRGPRRCGCGCGCGRGRFFDMSVLLVCLGKAHAKKPARARVTSLSLRVLGLRCYADAIWLRWSGPRQRDVGLRLIAKHHRVELPLPGIEIAVSGRHRVHRAGLPIRGDEARVGERVVRARHEAAVLDVSGAVWHARVSICERSSRQDGAGPIGDEKLAAFLTEDRRRTDRPTPAPWPTPLP